MAGIKRPGKYEHANPNLPIVDAGNVAGGFFPVDTIALRNSVPIAKRSRLVNVKNVGLFNYTGTDFENDNWIDTANWFNITEAILGKAAKEGDQTQKFKVEDALEDNEAVNLGQLKNTATFLKTDDAFYFDETGILRPNISKYTERIVYKNGSQKFELAFDPTEILSVKVYNATEEAIDIMPDQRIFTSPNYLEILGTIEENDIVLIVYNHFVTTPIYN